MTAPFRQELRRIIGDDSLLDFTYLQGNMDSVSYPGKCLYLLVASFGAMSY